MEETKICSNRQGHVTVMAGVCQYMVKTFKTLLQNQVTEGLETLHGVLGT